MYSVKLNKPDDVSDAYRWCKERWGTEITSGKNLWSYTGSAFVFTNAEDAILFKITWG